MPMNRRARFRWIAALAFAVATVCWHGVAAAQATAPPPKPGTAQPTPPKDTAKPDFVPSETVSTEKPVSFPTDI
jgi:hypothetical protein